MKYLKLRARPVKILKIDLDTFTYPELVLHNFRERNGQNEIEDVVTVYASEFTFFYSTSLSDWDKVAGEVREANRDPKMFWSEQLDSLLKEERASLETQIEHTKAQLRYVKKMQKKLGKDS